MAYIKNCKFGILLSMNAKIKSLLKEVQDDEYRNGNLLHLTANEPALSQLAKSYLSSELSSRYYFGGGDEEGVVDFQPSSFLGLSGVEALIREATESSASLLNGDSVNISCHSGLHAMLCSILSTTEVGDCVMSLSVEDGGHFSTSTIIQKLGRINIFASFDQANLRLNTHEIAYSVKLHNVKAIYLDASFYLNPHNLRELRDAVGEGVIIIYDASHTVGLMLGQQFQQPLLEGADIISANTHKTLPGPQKGMLVMRSKLLSEKVNGLIGGGLISSPHTAEMIALSITLLEMKEFGKEYASSIIENSRSLGASLLEKGYELRRANTGAVSENHQLHLYTDTIGDYRKLYQSFLSNNLSVNFSNTLGGRMFIRIGTQEITRRGMSHDEMSQIANFIDSSLRGKDVGDDVVAFNKVYNKVYYSYDN